MIPCNDNIPYRPDLIAEALRLINLAIDNGLFDYADESETLRVLRLMMPYELQATIIEISHRIEEA